MGAILRLRLGLVTVRRRRGSWPCGLRESDVYFYPKRKRHHMTPGELEYLQQHPEIPPRLWRVALAFRKDRMEVEEDVRRAEKSGVTGRWL